MHFVCVCIHICIGITGYAVVLNHLSFPSFRWICCFGDLVLIYVAAANARYGFAPGSSPVAFDGLLEATPGTCRSKTFSPLFSPPMSSEFSAGFTPQMKRLENSLWSEDDGALQPRTLDSTTPYRGPVLQREFRSEVTPLEPATNTHERRAPSLRGQRPNHHYDPRGKPSYMASPFGGMGHPDGRHPYQSFPPSAVGQQCCLCLSDCLWICSSSRVHSDGLLSHCPHVVSSFIQTNHVVVFTVSSGGGPEQPRHSIRAGVPTS